MVVLPPDGIPSIDNPKFISVVEAGKFLKESDLVVGLTINGQTKAYPLLILVWHEIVNDKVGSVPCSSYLLSSYALLPKYSIVQ